ncbi:response regulator transcription factor [Paenibacillus sp. JCM 10914]
MMMNILVVDDEHVIRNGVKRTINAQFPDYCVFLADNPESALALLKNESIDIVLTDVCMPGMTGIELMEVSHKTYRKMKWVFISAYSEFEYVKQALSLGAKEYLLKPIGKDSLIDIIHRLSHDISQEKVQFEELYLLKNNMKFLQEAVFIRLMKGLDLGNINVKAFTQDYSPFHMILVKISAEGERQLEHFIIENVMTEMIQSLGAGFVVSIDSHRLVGVVKLEHHVLLVDILEQLTTHLSRYLKVTFQVKASNLIHDVYDVSPELTRMLKSSVIKVDSEQGSGQRAIDLAKQYMQENYHKELSLDQISSMVYLNSVYFSQLFKQRIGVGFKEYLIHLRIDRALQLLKETDMKIAEISNVIGYDDVRHFSQIFRKKYGVTPSEYRAKI